LPGDPFGGWRCCDADPKNVLLGREERPRVGWRGSFPGSAAEFPALGWACRHADAISSARRSESLPDANGSRFPALRS
jgi:hypothetical protein